MEVDGGKVVGLGVEDTFRGLLGLSLGLYPGAGALGFCDVDGEGFELYGDSVAMCTLHGACPDQCEGLLGVFVLFVLGHLGDTMCRVGAWEEGGREGCGERKKDKKWRRVVCAQAAIVHRTGQEKTMSWLLKKKSRI